LTRCDSVVKFSNKEIGWNIQNENEGQDETHRDKASSYFHLTLFGNKIARYLFVILNFYFFSIFHHFLILIQQTFFEKNCCSFL
jgi:hypothetical protein